VRDDEGLLTQVVDIRLPDAERAEDTLQVRCVLDDQVPERPLLFHGSADRAIAERAAVGGIHRDAGHRGGLNERLRDG
jgi:hypothetical protein